MRDYNSTMEYEWPYNLLSAAGYEFDDPLEHVADEWELLLAMCVAKLTDREKRLIAERYMLNKTLKDVGTELGVQSERARQIEAKALRKLRHSSPEYILTRGAKAWVDKRVNEKIDVMLEVRKQELEVEYMQKMQQLANDKPVDVYAKVLAITIEELDLSVRSYNCLKRSWCDTVKDIVERFPTFKDAMNIRNLGRKSFQEVSEKLKNLGIAWPIYEEDDERWVY